MSVQGLVGNGVVDARWRARSFPRGLRIVNRHIEADQLGPEDVVEWDCSSGLGAMRVQAAAIGSCSLVPQALVQHDQAVHAESESGIAVNGQYVGSVQRLPCGTYGILEGVHALVIAGCVCHCAERV